MADWNQSGAPARFEPASFQSNAPSTRTSVKPLTGGRAARLERSPSRLPWILEKLDGIREGALMVSLADGRRYTLGDAKSDQVANMRIRRPLRLAARVLLSGEMGFHEGYLEGDWDSPDVVKVLSVLARNEAGLLGRIAETGLIGAVNNWRHRSRENTRAGSRRNIAAHYDLGNDFYARWLDVGMTYSAGLFEGSAATDEAALEQAQTAKYQRMLDLLDASEGQHLLEIGCGWGGFAIHAALRGMRVTGITLSREQFDFATRRVKEAGLGDRVELILMDYRDLPERFPDGFDHIVSIEMFEAVGQERWGLYFDVMKACLRPGGAAALQIITIDEDRFDAYAQRADFIQTHVFPGGMLPSPARFERAAASAGLNMAQRDFFALDYAHTLRIWRERFMAVKDTLPGDRYDQRFHRLWEYYLAYCEAGFRLGFTDLMQVRLDAIPR